MLTLIYSAMSMISVSVADAKKGNKRRISCKDLGGGDCHGWLYKKDVGRLRDKWSKYWFVLKDCNLYYYKQQEVTNWSGIIIMSETINY